MFQIENEEMRDYQSASRENFDIQLVRNDLIVCTFDPKNRFINQKFEIIVRKSSKFFELCETVRTFDKVNWWTLNYLAVMCEHYNGRYLT